MTSPEQRPEAAPRGGCGRPDLAVRLPDWDSLDGPAQRELTDHAASCPACAPKWELIRLADAWVEDGLPAERERRQRGETSAVASGPALCPSADELYDLGRGPGARQLSELERVGLRSHVAQCGDCAALVATLAKRPPSPLLFGSSGEFRLAAARIRRWQVWVPLAAAAALLAAFVILQHEAGARIQHAKAEPHIRYPAAQLVRGEAGGALLYPRDRLLAGQRGLASKLEFEIAPQERSTSYRAELARHDGGLFATPVSFLRVEGATARLSASDTSVVSLAPGHYTWEAWAVVDGLDVPLGRRDFEVVRDDGLMAQIAEREHAPEPARSESILHLLHDAGYVTDARAFARTLPSSRERDEYLARRPVR